MKTLNRCLTIFFAICLTLSLFSMTACKEEVKTEYYSYSSAEIEVDLEISQTYEYKDFATEREQFLKEDVLQIAQEMNSLYSGNIAKLNGKKLVWYMTSGVEEYTISSSSGNKVFISEVDAETYNTLNRTLQELGATIEEMTVYLEKDGNSLELSVEISALQTVFDQEKLSAEYDFEYSFTKTDARPEKEEDKNPTATYKYKGLALEVDVEVIDGESTSLPENFDGQFETSIKTAMQNALATYNTSYTSAKLSVYEDKVVWRYAGIKTPYSVTKTDDNEREMDGLDKGVVKTLKELINLYGKIGSNFTFNSTESKVITSGNSCILVIDVDAKATVLNQGTPVQVTIEYEYTVNFKK